jgi:hypothetical protein
MHAGRSKANSLWACDAGSGKLMKATSKNGHEWNGEPPVDGWWIYTDEAGRLYESREIPAYRIRLNATQVTCADGKLAIAPLQS